MIPFLPGGRRRDPETDAHVRAQTLLAERLDGPITDQDEGWLEDHLLTCDACVAAGIDYREQGELLRAMPWPEPPRDLAARTRAALELEAGGRSGGGSPRRNLIPLGALSGALVVAVVVGASFLSQPTVTPMTGSPGPTTPNASAAPSQVVARATPIPVGAGAVGFVLQRDDGTYALSYAPVEKVCTAETRADCPHLNPPVANTLSLDAIPRAIVSSPSGSELVVVDDHTRTTGGSVVALVAPTPAPPATPPPSGAPSTGPTVGPSPSPLRPLAIATDVIVVGETAAYSSDGAWFAFSARPSEGKQGPDVFVWQPGMAAARAVTTDHATVFAGWLGDTILASRATAASPEPSPEASPGTSPSPDATATTDAGPSPEATASADPDASPDASQSPEPSPSPTAGVGDVRGRTVLLDPKTGAETGTRTAVWRPVVDPTGRLAVYWDGTLAPDQSGLGWVPAEGSLVVTTWDQTAVDPVPSAAPSAAPTASPDASSDASPDTSPSASPDASPTGAPSPSPSPIPSPGDGLTGFRVQLDGTPIDWDIRWDESGTRFALWIADPFDPAVGQLSLHVVDRASGRLDPAGPVLTDTEALAGFSIGRGRLAWATPAGQDGQGSRVQVLAWSGDAAGQAESDPEPGSVPVIVIR